MPNYRNFVVIYILYFQVQLWLVNMVFPVLLVVRTLQESSQQVGMQAWPILTGQAPLTI